MPSHFGTHMDAPAHIHKGGQTVDEIPLVQLISPAVIVDHSYRCQYDPNDELQVNK